MAGCPVRSGEQMLLPFPAANHDPAAFENAGEFQLDRARNRHVAFGSGPHRCLGSHLARMELEVALQVWHERIPEYAIAPGELPRYSPGIREVQYLPLVFGSGG